MEINGAQEFHIELKVMDVQNVIIVLEKNYNDMNLNIIVQKYIKKWSYGTNQKGSCITSFVFIIYNT